MKFNAILFTFISLGLLIGCSSSETYNLLIKKGFYADITVFDTGTIQDKSTFETPHQYATGMQHVFINGTQVLKNGEHTGAYPGKVVRGPGWNGK